MLTAVFALGGLLLGVVNGQSCLAGQIPDSSMLSMVTSSCVNCPSGTYSNDGDTSCSSCPVGQASPAGSSTCGYYLEFTSTSGQLDSPQNCANITFSAGDMIILDCSSAKGSCFLRDDDYNFYISTLYSANYTFQPSDSGTIFTVSTDSLDGVQLLGYNSQSFALDQVWNQCTNLNTFAAPAYGPSYNYTTTGSFSAGFENDYAWNAKFSSPGGLVYDSMMNIYIADSSNNVIRKLEYSSAVVVTYAGDAYGASGSSDGYRVCAYDDAGNYLSGSTFFNPIGLAIDANDNIYVSDTWNVAIRKIDTKSGYVSTIIGPNSPEFDSPQALAISSSGLLYIADYTKSFIKTVDLKNNNAISLPTSMKSIGFATGLAIDASNNIYVSAFDVDYQTYVIKYFDYNAVSIKNVTSAFFAEGLAVDAKGNVFIAASSSGLQMIENGTVSIINVDLGDALFGDIKYIAIAPYYGYMAITDFDYSVVYQLYPQVMYSTPTSNVPCTCETTSYLFATPTHTIYAATVTYSSVNMAQVTATQTATERGGRAPSATVTRKPSTGNKPKSAINSNSAASSYNSTAILSNKQTESPTTTDTNNIFIGFAVVLVLILIIMYHFYHSYYSTRKKNQVGDMGGKGSLDVTASDSTKTKAKKTKMFKLKGVPPMTSDPEATVRELAHNCKIPILNDMSADEKERLANYLNSR